MLTECKNCKSNDINVETIAYIIRYKMNVMRNDCVYIETSDFDI